jgi:hypothetical protein
MPEPLTLDSLRCVLEQIERLPPPVVLEVSLYVPDDIVLDYTAMERQANDWFRRSGWPTPAGQSPREQRFILSGGALGRVRSAYPELFTGPFPIPVVLPHASKSPPAS